MSRLLMILVLGLPWIASAAVETSSTYLSNLKMREERRVGAGLNLGGSSGVFGAHAELNIEDADSAMVKFGIGRGFSTFGVDWKHSFEGEALSPYFTVGWSRWYNSSGSEKPDSYLLDAMLNDDEKRDGRFGLDFVVGSVGYQYHELSGDWTGVSLFAELSLLATPFRGRALPGAALGATYFF